MKTGARSPLLKNALLICGGVFVCGASAQTLTTLHHFTGNDGANPFGALVSSGGTLYGTTRAGGNFQNGTIFAISADGTGFTNLYHFTGAQDGAVPAGSLTLVGNTLYGTTTIGGSSSNGTVFSIGIDGTGFINLHSFSASDGVVMPNDGLAYSAGILYGTSRFGGTTGSGGVFAISTNGTGFTSLYSFTGFHFGSTNADGAVPTAGVICSSNMLYGTANYGGSSGYGTVYALKTDGSGFRNLLSFTEPSGQSQADPTVGTAGLILVDNVIYGTTKFGGPAGAGEIFRLNTDGTGFWRLAGFDALGTLLAPPFTQANNDGAFPNALVLTRHTLPGKGIFYGTGSGGGWWGFGTVFARTLDVAGIVEVLYSFTYLPNTQTNPDGEKPNSLAFLDNNLYGSTYAGGSASSGTIFGITLSQPRLTTILSDTNVVLTWPVAAGFKLQSTTNLAAPTWTKVSSPQMLVNDQSIVTNPISTSQLFFRLSNE